MIDKEKLKLCIDISNEYRKTKAGEIFKDLTEKQEIKVKLSTLLGKFKTYINSWLDKEWFKKASIFLIIIKLLFFPIACLLYFLFTTMVYIWQNILFKRNMNQTKMDYEIIKKRLMCDYSINECHDFISFWNSKGLSRTSNTHIDKFKISFSEDTIVECILRWYAILKDSDYANKLYMQLKSERAQAFVQARNRGIRINLEQVSSTLLNEINFRF